jgi:hypothetical protein
MGGEGNIEKGKIDKSEEYDNVDISTDRKAVMNTVKDREQDGRRWRNRAAWRWRTWRRRR